MTGSHGFSLVETLLALGLTVGVTTAVFTLLDPARGAVLAEPEMADVQQRARTAGDTLFRDLLESLPPQLPYRTGRGHAPSVAAITDDTITLIFASAARRIYYLRGDTAQLMRYDGAGAGVPVVDRVVGLRFTYLAQNAGGLTRLAAEELVDGPWLPDPTSAARYDADLLRIRLISVNLRVAAAWGPLRSPSSVQFVDRGRSPASRWLPDHVMEFNVLPRNNALQR